jgi:hypothetical protein
LQFIKKLLYLSQYFLPSLFMNSRTVSRLLAGFTVAAVVLVWASSGAFGAFSLVLLSGQTCTGYSYGYDANLAMYGFGYECNVPAPVVSSGPGGGGGGGGGGTPGGTPLPVPSTTPTPNPTPTTTSPTDTPPVVVTPTVGTPEQAEKPITRAEFVKMLAEAVGFDADETVTKKKFRDVGPRSKYAQYINFGVVHGWINVKNTKFRPNDIITRGEAQKLIDVVNGEAIADTVADPTATVTRAEAVDMIIKWLGL